jgi:methylated-DNA-protein-cysteine methyltransferase-like protein
MDDLWILVKKIPRGRVASYGALGRALDRPVSGFLVGRAMARCQDDVPWWRVVAKDGRLPVDKRDPELAQLQIRHLRQEKTEMADETTVAPSAFVEPEELD